MRKTLVGTVAAALLAVLLLPTPAQAAAVEWTDKEGDATIFLVTGITAPTEDQLDIIKTRVEVRQHDFVWTVTVKRLAPGTPFAATGHNFRLTFKHQDTLWEFRYGEDSIWGDKAFSMRDAAAAVIPCATCAAVLDRVNRKLTATAPIASMNAAMKSVKKDHKQLGSGSQLKDFNVIASRQILGPPGPPVRGLLANADESLAPPNLVLTI